MIKTDQNIVGNADTGSHRTLVIRRAFLSDVGDRVSPVAFSVVLMCFYLRATTPFITDHVSHFPLFLRKLSSELVRGF